MNKKFLSAILFGALTVASTGSFVSCKDYDDDIDNLQTQINGLASAKDLSDKVANLQSQIASAQSAAEAKAAAAQAVAEAAKAAAEKAGASAADVAKALEAAVAELEAKGATKEEVEAVKTAAAEAKAAAEAAATDAAAALEAAEAKLDAAVKAAEEKAEAAQKAADEAKAAVAALEAAGASKEDLKAVENAAVAAQAAADKAQAAADAAAADAAANKEALKEAAAKSEADLAAALVKVAANTTAIAAKADATAVEALIERVKALEEAIPGLAGEESVKALASLATTLSGDVKKISEQLGIISKRLTSVVFAPTSYINGIEAIKFINLKYNDWSTDPEKWLANAADYKDANGNQIKRQVADYGAKVEYMVSPDGVTMDGIKDLKFLLNDASNTRATAKAADVELSFIEEPTIDNGKLVGYVKKTVKKNKSLPTPTTSNDPENLIVASLKATIADNLKTAEEKDTEVAVYSDWTRVNEEVGTPYIHSTLDISDKHYWNFSWMYWTSYRVSDDIIPDNSKKSAVDAVYTLQDEFYGVAKAQVYNEPLDLLDLVTVCIDDNDIIADYTRYGLEYEFHLMDYKVRNMNPTATDITNQKDFATLEGSILTSRAENGLTNNKNAVGRTPMIQAVLKDPKNNAVVDVKYFKIKWVEKAQETQPWDKPFVNVAPWQCTAADGSDNYKVYILEEDMNDFYSKIVDGGIDKNVFYTQYPTMSPIYLGELTDEVKEAVLANEAELTKIGTASWAQHLDATIQTQNILLNYTFINPRVDEDEDGVEENTEKAQPEQDFEKTGFFWFISADQTGRIFVPVKINVKKGSYAYAVSKEPAMWNDAKDTRKVNPQLRTNTTFGIANFKTTQMIGSLQAGYYKTLADGNKPQPETINELINHLNYDGSFDKLAISDIIFDADKVSALPTRKTTAKYAGAKQNCVWHVEENGKALCNGYWFENEWKEDLLAAVIDDEGNIYLTDTKFGTSLGDVYTTTGAEYPSVSNPNAAALLLVGQSVPVKVTAKNCEVSDFDTYAVNFLTPLKFNGFSETLDVFDLTEGGSTATISLGTICLEEIFLTNNSKIVIVEPKAPTAPHKPTQAEFVGTLSEGTAEYDAAVLEFKEADENYTKVLLPAYNKQKKAYETAYELYHGTTNTQLIQWYGVQGMYLDLGNAKTDLLTGKFDTKLSEITVKVGEGDYLPKYNLSEEIVNGITTGFTFQNIDGNAIQQDINIQIPVKVDTKWQKDTDLKGVINVTIHAAVK